MVWRKATVDLLIIQTIKHKTMPLYRISIKQNIRTNGVVLEKGMSVQIPTATATNPVTVNGGQSVADAFMRLYGVDIKKAGAISSGYLEVEKIG